MKYFVVLLEVKRKKVQVSCIYELDGLLEDMKPTQIVGLWNERTLNTLDMNIYRAVIIGTNGLVGFVSFPYQASTNVDPSLRESYCRKVELCCADNSVNTFDDVITHHYNATITAVAYDTRTGTLVTGDNQGKIECNTSINIVYYISSRF